jgi:hypothetical protein
MYTNNIPLTAPHLQAEWWRADFDSLSIPNVWVLGIWDTSYSFTHCSRSFFTWTGGRGTPWTQDGETFTSFITLPNDADRIKLSPRPSLPPVPMATIRTAPRSVRPARRRPPVSRLGRLAVRNAGRIASNPASASETRDVMDVSPSALQGSNEEDPKASVSLPQSRLRRVAGRLGSRANHLGSA